MIAKVRRVRFTNTLIAALIVSSTSYVSQVAAAGDPVPTPAIEPVIKIGPSPFGDPLPAADGSGRQIWFERQRPNWDLSPTKEAKPKLGSVLFFPPESPRFDQPSPDFTTPTLITDERFSAPPRLHEYVAEYFYPALGARLFSRALSAKLESRLTAYQRTRDSFVAELTRQFTTVAHAAPAVREQTLRAFATTQTPRLVAREGEAEQLRKALLKRGVFERTLDWNSSRRWKLGDRSIPNELYAEAEFQVIRAAAFDLEGLSSAQRGLLRELTSGLQLNAVGETPAVNERAMFFSPEGAWLTLPAALPLELGARLAAYRRDRSELKQQLRKTIVDLDAASEAIRSKTLIALNERQRPALVALDLRAEEIRRILAALPEFSVALPPVILPPDLAQRIAAHQRESRALVQEKGEALSSIGNPEPPFFDEGKIPLTERVWHKPKSDQVGQLREAVIREFERKHRERYAAQQQLGELIQRELTQLAHQQFPTSTEPLDADALLRDFEAASSKGPLTYRLALLQPGLSPEQRRLLFNAALIELAPALPAGAAKPSFPPPTPAS